MRGLSAVLERKLASIESDATAFFGADFVPREIRLFAAGSRACAGRQALVYLASLLDMGDAVIREHEASARRHLIALDAALLGVDFGLVQPADVLADAVDAMSSDRATMLRFVVSMDEELLEDRVREILEETPPPALGSDDTELIDAAHRALDAQDAATVTIASYIEQRYRRDSRG